MNKDESGDSVGVVLLLDGVRAGLTATEARIVNCRYAQIDAKMLGDLLPEVVIMPLFGKGYDALDALQHLARLGYRGLVIVRGPVLPNRASVERELAATVPDLTVRLTGPLN